MTDITIASELSLLLDKIPVITKIANKRQYDRALTLMDAMIDDYEKYRSLIIILAKNIESWEVQSPDFIDFNESVKECSGPESVFKCLIDQHGLTNSDFEGEIGKQSAVSKILSDKYPHKLKRDHIEALSKRFSIPTSIFFG
ncbi:helix-turn-helix domain-containing protein [Ferrimonas kyonanensis]|uniref:helix-turn-helix domain-containing protein n=1 Tax=Ferrimonas kyonanensis TaxID=364763 RepID=UPI0005581AF8|nr:hypothetical protein [Ferrimonas kyonanensis]